MNGQLENDALASGHDILVIGLSRGGKDALIAVLEGLPADLPATLFIVQHRGRAAALYLERILGASTSLPICFVQNGQPIQPGCVYLAPPDHHLLIWRDHLQLSRGPRENGSRPAIDVLFRSAAVNYGPRVVGVVLSGLLNDGTLGLQAIQACGGVTVVQDPEEAAFPDMPLNALEELDVDHCLPAAAIGTLLNDLAREPAGPASPVPLDLVAEVRIAAQSTADLEESRTEDQEKARQVFTCPGCGGPLSPIPDPSLLRYRCRIGHAYTAIALDESQAEMTEGALGAAVRTLGERAQTLTRLAAIYRKKERAATAADCDRRASEALSHAETIRQIMS